MWPQHQRVVKLYKRPFSVLVVIYTPDLQLLLLERADHPGYWQSVTGSCDSGESPAAAAVREVGEETGLNAHDYRLDDWNLRYEFEIFAEWRYRYAPGVTHNTEQVFGLEVPAPLAVTLAPREHLAFAWSPWLAAEQRVFSWSNAAAIRHLSERIMAE